jgi:hypothetical protein
VPIPFISKTVEGFILNNTGTKIEAPNIANKCWKLNGMLTANGGLSFTCITLFVIVVFH